MQQEWTAEEIKALEEPDTWDWDSFERREPSANPGAAFTVEFSLAEKRLVYAAARAAEVSVFEFIRQATLEKARGS